MTLSVPPRRLALVALGAAGLSACGTSPPVQLYHLRSEAPVPTPGPDPALPPEVWQLLLPVRVPEYLDREALLLPQGQTGLLALSGHRWAESLRDAVPRVLRQDLATLRGDDRVWTAPVPSGVPVKRQLRVDILGLEVDADRQGVRLQARWTWLDPSGQLAPRHDSARILVASAGSAIDSLVAAHRLALWRLAERIAAVR